MWSIVGDDIIQFVRTFFISRECPTSINTIWVSLVPKVNNPTKIEELRPISAVGCLYKIVSKVIANRLKTIIAKVISKTQTGFIQGRYIWNIESK